MGGWVDSRTVWTTWRRENSWPYRDSNSDLSAVQPVASRYTDCTIPAPLSCLLAMLNYSCISSFYVSMPTTIVRKLKQGVSLLAFQILWEENESGERCEQAISRHSVPNWSCNYRSHSLQIGQWSSLAGRCWWMLWVVKTAIFWDTASCSLVEFCWRFGETCCFHLQYSSCLLIRLTLRHWR
jgi:hypothetical protein